MLFRSPLLKSVIPEALPLLLGSALASGRTLLELAGISSIRHEKLLPAFHRSHPSTETLPCKPNTSMLKLVGRITKL